MTIEEIETLLKSKGIRLCIGGCGCCGSPWVALEVDGELIVGSKTTAIWPVQKFDFNNFEDDEVDERDHGPAD